MMMRLTSIAALASLAAVTGCTTLNGPEQPVTTVRTEPTYQSADANNFLASSQDAINKLTDSELGGHLMNIHIHFDGRTIVSTVIDPFVYRGLTFHSGSTFTIDAAVVLDYTD